MHHILKDKLAAQQLLLYNLQALIWREEVIRGVYTDCQYFESHSVLQAVFPVLGETQWNAI